MHLTVLGCSGSLPGPNAAASGYLVEAAGARLVVDLGNGTLAALLAHQDPFELDAVLFSHLHPDHCADFSALTVLRRYHPRPPVDPRAHRLPVYGPSDAADRFAVAYAPDAGEAADTDLSDVFTFHTLATAPEPIAGYTVTAARVDHPCEAYGMRIERDGRSLCYTGDSALCDALVTLATGVHTLLAEASWTEAPDRPANLHMSGRQAGELAAKAGVGRLVVTHVLPWADKAAVLAEARAAFAGDVVLAEPGVVYDV
ncbi:MAG TPA: MBL fold metallo-hydrolase [Pseudonocardiaceae bacterium]|nr:MBL fold metallo-hydrolase [Pseudonocardiaceae bacterium]